MKVTERSLSETMEMWEKVMKMNAYGNRPCSVKQQLCGSRLCIQEKERLNQNDWLMRETVYSMNEAHEPSSSVAACLKVSVACLVCGEVYDM